MREVGISGLSLDYPHSGSAVYAQNLVPLLPEVGPEFTYRLYRRWAAPLAGTVATQRLATPFTRVGRRPGVGARLDKLLWEIGSFPVAAGLRGDALVHSLYFASPVLAASPIVVTVHDVIPLVLPGYHRSRQSAVYSRFMAWAAARSAATIITVSEHARQDIVRMLRVPEERVHVTYEAVDGRFRPHHPESALPAVRKRYRLPDRFVLYAGGSERRKNLETLIRAWARVAPRLRDREVSLVVVARFPPPDPLYPDIPGLAASLGLTDVRFIGEVSEEDKPAVYACALAFCFPSLYEGFGFPPLEAMASGVPTLSSDAASLPEVVGDGGLLLDPQDVEAWADALERVVESSAMRRELGRRGVERAAGFCWRRTAQQTVQVYRSVLG
jgi:glycosyltransferase involved in cell wall biosynthesis